MAATDPRPFHTHHMAKGPIAFADQTAGQRGRGRGDAHRALECLDAQKLHERVEEEVGRANRHGTALCCLSLRLENFTQIAEAHGEAFSEQALLHAGQTLCAELRRFDRVGRPLQDELVLVLPGAASVQGEAVARRALSRLQAIKIEVDRQRRPLCVSIGIAAWRTPWSAQQLIEEARCASGAMHQSTDG